MVDKLSLHHAADGQLLIRARIGHPQEGPYKARGVYKAGHQHEGCWFTLAHYATAGGVHIHAKLGAGFDTHDEGNPHLCQLCYAQLDHQQRHPGCVFVPDTHFGPYQQNWRPPRGKKKGKKARKSAQKRAWERKKWEEWEGE